MTKCFGNICKHYSKHKEANDEHGIGCTLGLQKWYGIDHANHPGTYCSDVSQIKPSSEVVRLNSILNKNKTKGRKL